MKVGLRTFGTSAVVKALLAAGAAALLVGNPAHAAVSCHKIKAKVSVKILAAASRRRRSLAAACCTEPRKAALSLTAERSRSIPLQGL